MANAFISRMIPVISLIPVVSRIVKQREEKHTETPGTLLQNSEQAESLENILLSAFAVFVVMMFFDTVMAWWSTSFLILYSFALFWLFYNASWTSRMVCHVFPIVKTYFLQYLPLMKESFDFLCRLVMEFAGTLRKKKIAN